MQFKESSTQVPLLDPTLDVVFKLLLLRNEAPLRDMIESVLNPPTQIVSLVVLNPEIPEDAPGDKCIVLDIRVRLEDGRLIRRSGPGFRHDPLGFARDPRVGAAQAAIGED